MSDYADVSFDAMSNDTITYPYEDVYLVVNATGSLGDWSEVFNRTRSNADTAVKSKPRGEWLDLFYEEADGPKVSVSLWFTAFSSMDMAIDIEGQHPNPEFQSIYKNPFGTLDIDPTLDKRIGPNQRNYSLPDRGVLQLKKQDSWIGPSPPLTNEATTLVLKGYLHNNQEGETNYSIPFCFGCVCSTILPSEALNATN
jgi:hypothetical protein